MKASGIRMHVTGTVVQQLVKRFLRVTAPREKKAPRSLSMTGASPREQYFHTCVAPYQKDPNQHVPPNKYLS